MICLGPVIMRNILCELIITVLLTILLFTQQICKYSKSLRFNLLLNAAYLHPEKYHEHSNILVTQAYLDVPDLINN